MKKELKLYGLFDAALIPKVWFNLEAWQLNFEPLYQGNYQPIAEAIPYLIELNRNTNSYSVDELLEDDAYRAGLLIISSLEITELVEILASFYHIIGYDNKPYLRRFFDIRFFNNFVNSLSLEELKFLFGKDTTFYYFVSEKKGYRQYQLNSSLALTTSFIDLLVLKEEINRLYLEKTNEIK
ncbi:DUF4123 domain-containing protein [Rodentibacter pneumotropicus]|uniref:DUF4123 domain-containing protein n=1 Tax=Rodentibacter pneumotropicus TaxID=758 RepID=UPI00098799E0|nr:DUF4123 domain-containing protein [Rodentibacter pneumotropicus]OOF58874.1 hypothetical protein BKL50_10900 [Rodentibacter pneumotropicus]